MHFLKLYFSAGFRQFVQGSKKNKKYTFCVDNLCPQRNNECRYPPSAIQPTSQSGGESNFLKGREYYEQARNHLHAVGLALRHYQWFLDTADHHGNHLLGHLPDRLRWYEQRHDGQYSDSQLSGRPDFPSYLRHHTAKGTRGQRKIRIVPSVAAGRRRACGFVPLADLYGPRPYWDRPGPVVWHQLCAVLCILQHGLFRFHGHSASDGKGCGPGRVCLCPDHLQLHRKIPVLHLLRDPCQPVRSGERRPGLLPAGCSDRNPDRSWLWPAVLCRQRL